MFPNLLGELPSCGCKISFGVVVWYSTTVPAVHLPLLQKQFLAEVEVDEHSSSLLFLAAWLLYLFSLNSHPGICLFSAPTGAHEISWSKASWNLALCMDPFVGSGGKVPAYLVVVQIWRGHVPYFKTSMKNCYLSHLVAGRCSASPLLACCFSKVVLG